MKFSRTPLSDKLNQIVRGDFYSEAALRTCSAQIKRLAAILHINVMSSNQDASSVALAQKIVSACDKDGKLSRLWSQEGCMMALVNRLDAGAKAISDVLDGNTSADATFRMGDAAVILWACEKEGLLLDPQRHWEAHYAAIKGIWDAPALDVVGTLLIDGVGRVQQIDDHYVRLPFLELERENYVRFTERLNEESMKYESSSDNLQNLVAQSEMALKRRIEAMGLSDDPSFHYDLYANMNSDSDSEVGKAALSKVILLRLVDLAATAERIQAAEIADMHSIEWPDQSFLQTDLDRFEIGRSFSNKTGLEQYSIQLRATEEGGSTVFASEVMDLHELLDRTEEMLRAERTAMLFSPIPDPEGDGLQDLVDQFEANSSEDQRPVAQ